MGWRKRPEGTGQASRGGVRSQPGREKPATNPGQEQRRSVGSAGEDNSGPTQQSRWGVLALIGTGAQKRGHRTRRGSWGVGGGGRENREQFPSGALAPFSHPPHPNRIRNRAQLTDKAETSQILQVQAEGSRPDRGRCKCAQDFHTGRPWVVADPEADEQCQGFH